jgi:hypothetical protein
MSNQLLLANGTTHKLLAPVIPIRNRKKNEGEQKINLREKKESKLPSFYTEPIFKAKKHDCL